MTHISNNYKITIGTKIRSKANPDEILCIISNDCHGDKFECADGNVLSLKQIEKYYDIISYEEIPTQEEKEPEMVNKQEFIEKACKIYKKHLIKFNPTLKEFPAALDDYVNIFRKQIEE